MGIRLITTINDNNAVIVGAAISGNDTNDAFYFVSIEDDTTDAGTSAVKVGLIQ